ncbi:hypothetical protein ACOMHN_039134 [Nucella lapillus]
MPISLPPPPPSPQPTTTTAAATTTTTETRASRTAARAEFGSCSPLVKAGVALNVASFLTLWVAVLAPYWLVNAQLQIYLGALYGCRGDGQCTSSSPLSWQVAVAGLEISGLAFGFPSLAFTLRFVFAPVTSCKKWVKVTTGLLAIGAALFVFIGVLVCAVKKDETLPTFDLGWAFGVGVCACGLYIGCAVCFLLDAAL